MAARRTHIGFALALLVGAAFVVAAAVRGRADRGSADAVGHRGADGNAADTSVDGVGSDDTEPIPVPDPPPALPPVPAVPAAGSAVDAVRTLIADRRAAVVADRSNAAAWLELALAFHANELEDDAVRCYHAALALDGDRAPPWFHLAACLARRGDFEEARAAYDRAARLEPTFAAARWRRGFLDLDLGDAADADAAFRAAAAIDADEPAAAVGLALAALELGRPADAVAQLEALLARTAAGAGHEGYARLVLAGAYRRLGRVDDARRVLAGITDAAPPWRDAWTDALAAHRAGYAARMDRARAHIAAQRFRDALDTLDALARTQPDNVTVLTTRGLALRRAGRIDDAIAQLRAAVAAHPTFFDARVQLAVALLERGRRAQSGADRSAWFDAARTHVEAALALNPTYGPAHGVRGDLDLVEGAKAAALAHFIEAARCDPDDPRWPLRAGLTLISLARMAEAAAALRRAVALAPDDGQAVHALAVASLQAGALDDADDAWQRAHALLGETAGLRALRNAIDAARAAEGGGG